MILFFMIFCTSRGCNEINLRIMKRSYSIWRLKKPETFHQMTIEKLAKVEGGKNNWQANVSGVIAAGSAGAAIGFPVCGVACGYIGAKTAVTLWAGVTGATGGF